MQGPGIEQVAQLTANESKTTVLKSNLDDLNDFAKTYYFKQE
jgi:hypothetical protein